MPVEQAGLPSDAQSATYLCLTLESHRTALSLSLDICKMTTLTVNKMMNVNCEDTVSAQEMVVVFIHF